MDNTNIPGRFLPFFTIFFLNSIIYAAIIYGQDVCIQKYTFFLVIFTFYDYIEEHRIITMVIPFSLPFNFVLSSSFREVPFNPLKKEEPEIDILINGR
jgi:hypothetical protein